MLKFLRRLGFLLLFSLFYGVCFPANAQIKPAKSNLPNPPVGIEELLPSSTAAVLIIDGLGELLSSFDGLSAVKALEARVGQAEMMEAGTQLQPLRKYLTLGISHPKAIDAIRVGVVSLPGQPAPPVKGKGRQLASTAIEAIYFAESRDTEALNEARADLLAWIEAGAVDKSRDSQILEGIRTEYFKSGSIGVWLGNLYLTGKPEGIKKLIDTWMRRGSEKLTDDPWYLKAQLARHGSAGIWAYVNGSALSSLFSGIPRLGAGNLSELENLAGSRLDNIHASSYQLRLSSGLVDESLSIFLRPGGSGILRNIFSGPPIEFRGPGVISDSASVVASLSVDWKSFYDLMFLDVFYANAALSGPQIIGEPRSPGDSEIRKRALQEEKRTNRELGFDLKAELEKSLRNEITVAYGLPEGNQEATLESDAKKNGFAVLLACRDREAARSTILSFLSFQMEGIGPSTNAANADQQSDEVVRKRREAREASLNEELKTLQIDYKGFPLIDARIFSLGFVDEFVIIGSSANSVRSVIDRLADSRMASNSSRRDEAEPGGFRFFLGPTYADSAINRLIRQSASRPTELPDDLSSVSPLNSQFSVLAGADLKGDVLTFNSKSVLGVFGLFWAFSSGAETAQTKMRAEHNAQYVLRQISSAEKAYFDKNGRFTDASGLSAAKVTTFDFKRLETDTNGYKFELTIISEKEFAATATPVEYARPGRFSYYIDESGEIRGGDLGGRKAGKREELIATDNRNEN